MGHRSWLTEVNNVDDCKEVYNSILDNKFGYGVAYAILIEKDCMFKVGSVVMAWSADGNASIDELSPPKYINRTVLLDDYLEEYPEWHQEPKGPENFGKMLEVENIDLFLADINNK